MTDEEIIDEEIIHNETFDEDGEIETPDDAQKLGDSEEIGKEEVIGSEDEEQFAKLPPRPKGEVSDYSKNWFVIFPYKDLEMIQKAYESLDLLNFTTSIIVINDDLSEKQELMYTSFINKALKYSGLVGSSSSDEKHILQTIEDMGGCDGDELYIFKNGKLIHKKVDLLGL